MKFTRLFRSAAAIVLSATLCGCSIKFGTNIKPDNNHYVAKPSDSTLVDELGITYAEFMNDYTYYLNLLEITDDTQDSVSDICKSYREEIIKTLILEKICTVKAEEYGISGLTEEEENQVKIAADSIINQRISFYAEYADYGSVDPSALTEEEKKKRGGEELDKELAKYGFTRDDYYTKQRKYMLSYKLMQAVGEEIDRSEAEKIFDDYAKVAKETYESSISDYEQSGISQYYIPEGSRYIKHILISFSDDDVTALQTMRLTGDDEGADNLRAEKAEALDEKVNEVIGKLDAGENWDAVSNAYSADASASASYPDGYLVIPNGTMYMKEFQEAAFVPEKVGDRTTCVTDYGVHIMIYASEAKVKDSERQSIVNNIYNSLVKQEFVDRTTEWIEEYGFYDNMDYELLGIDPPEDEQTSQ
ncbi:MAG: peptidylprolyl isomerase [Oscillospiraceae bacterium]|nr:peptidylprolyl isomerase [Oscillospiraceae bacterium]